MFSKPPHTFKDTDLCSLSIYINALKSVCVELWCCSCIIGVALVTIPPSGGSTACKMGARRLPFFFVIYLLLYKHVGVAHNSLLIICKSPLLPDNLAGLELTSRHVNTEAATFARPRVLDTLAQTGRTCRRLVVINLQPPHMETRVLEPGLRKWYLKTLNI